MDQSLSSSALLMVVTQRGDLRTLQVGAGSIFLGSIILVAGLFALLVYATRRKPKAGLILWFGVIALLYGVRLLASTAAMQLSIGLSPAFWRYSVSFINYLILIPFALFLMEIYGSGWRSLLRVLLWIQILYAIAAILSDILRQTPESFFDPVYLFFAGLTVVLVSGRFHDYRPPFLEESRAIKIGLSVFIVSVINEHLVGFSLVPWSIRLEALCFFLLVILLGYIAARRFLRNEQKLLAMQHEMEAARQIQASILPHNKPDLEYCSVAVKYVPVASVAGDFYDFVAPDKNRTGILISDVAGHGVPAAMVASMLKVALLSQASSWLNPAAVLEGLNRILCDQPTGKFVTAGYLLIDPIAGSALYSGAAHPPLLVWRAEENSVIEHQENGLLLGFRLEEKYTNIRFSLSPGDRIFLYTDGITEIMNSSGDFFGLSRFKAFIESHSHMTLDRFADSLLDKLARWSGNKSNHGYADDVTLIVLEIGLPAVPKS